MIVRKYRVQLTNECVNTMQARTTDRYKELKKKIGAEWYLNASLPYTYKRLFFQFRCDNNYIAMRKACDLNGTRKNNFKCCDVCNLADVEDVFHVFLVCKHYKHLNIVSKMERLRNIEICRSNFVQEMFKANSENEINTICMFWIKAMKVRDFIRLY